MGKEGAKFVDCYVYDDRSGDNDALKTYNDIII